MSLNFFVIDPVFMYKWLPPSNFEFLYAVDHLKGEKKVDNTRFKTNLTVQGVHTWFYFEKNKKYFLKQSPMQVRWLM